MTAPSALVLDLAGGSTAAAAREQLLLTRAETSVVVAVPAWFGMADRHQLMTYLDPDGARPIGLVSSTLAGVYGHFNGAASRRSTSLVLCLDVRGGWSAGLVRVEPDCVTEVASWGIAPSEIAGRLDDSVTSHWLVDQLFSASEAVAGHDSIGAVLVFDDAGARADFIRNAVRECDLAPASCQVVVDRDSLAVTTGATLLRQPDGVASSVGALAHALTVRADGDPQRLAMHVVAAEHALIPSTTRHAFDLGPNDGSPLHFDVYEQHRNAPGEGVVDHRLVVRAHLIRERGYDQNMVVTFDLGSNGLLSIGPVKAWRLDWQPGTLALGSTR